VIVLVTGANGFVGRHAARRFAQDGHSVVGLGHGSWARDEWRLWGIDIWHSVDVTTDTLATYAGTPDIIVHCAGSGSVAYSMSHPRQDFERSVQTTLSVLEFQRLHSPGARLVIPSSAGVYGRVETMPIAIEAPLNPVSPYGTNKKIVEEIARSYAQHFGLSVAILRFFSIYGVGLRKQLLWDACGKFSRGDVDFSGTGDEIRDWLHVDDAAALIAAVSGIAGSECPIVNGGTGIGTSNRQVLTLLAQELSPERMPRFTGRSRIGDPQHYQAEMSSTAALPWHAARHLAEEITVYADWYKRGAP
jgi:UDP-glucose 4-epimerase